MSFIWAYKEHSVILWKKKKQNKKNQKESERILTGALSGVNQQSSHGRK